MMAQAGAVAAKTKRIRTRACWCAIALRILGRLTVWLTGAEPQPKRPAQPVLGGHEFTEFTLPILIERMSNEIHSDWSQNVVRGLHH